MRGDYWFSIAFTLVRLTCVASSSSLADVSVDCALAASDRRAATSDTKADSREP